MIDKINLPSTRFLGSKSKLIPWIHDKLKDVEFDSVLDAFGGTGSFGYSMKLLDKKVYYNDLLRFNQIIGKAIIENNKTSVGKKDVERVLNFNKKVNYKKVIQMNFRGIYFKDYENKWLDIVTQNIYSVKNNYKRAILLSALFQACLIKRPFNLFHRNNLNLRTNKNIERNFGNKTTWDTSFRTHFLRFVEEYNNNIFDNNRKNEVLGGYDLLKIPSRKYDLVYLDPPYLSKRSKINYLDCYHFLEGLSDYRNWEKRIDKESITKRMDRIDSVEKWINKEVILDLFEKMINKFRNKRIVLSYRNDGTPSPKEIKDVFVRVTKQKPKVYSRKYKYALSNGSTKELLFVC